MDLQEKLAASLQRAIVVADVRTGQELDALLKRFKMLALQRINAMREMNPERAARAVRVLDQTIAEFRMIPQDEQAAGASAQTGAAGGDRREDAPPVLSGFLLRPFFAGVFATLCVVVLAILLAAKVGYLSEYSVFTADDEHALTLPAADVASANRLIPEIVDTVRKAQDILENDPYSVTGTIDGSFVQVRDVFPTLYESMTPQARDGLGFVLRRDGSDYKILLTGRLCPVATAMSELERDPKREAGYTTLCQYYGVWNEGGKDF